MDVVIAHHEITNPYKTTANDERAEPAGIPRSSALRPCVRLLAEPTAIIRRGVVEEPNASGEGRPLRRPSLRFGSIACYWGFHLTGVE